MYGEFTEDVTGLGVGIQFAGGLTGFDAPLDVRDAIGSASKGDLQGFVLNSLGIIPVIGAIKNLKHLDEAADVVDEVQSAGRRIQKTTDQAADAVPTGTADEAVYGAARAEASVSNAELVQRIASRAEAKIGGTGALAGTDKHTYAKNLLNRYQRMFGDRGLQTEISIKGGRTVPYGTSGSVRLDVLEGPVGDPTGIFDYKFGQKGLSPGRIDQIRRAGGYGPDVPVYEVRP